MMTQTQIDNNQIEISQELFQSSFISLNISSELQIITKLKVSTHLTIDHFTNKQLRNYQHSYHP